MNKILNFADRFIFLLKKPAAVLIFGFQEDLIAKTILHLTKNKNVKLYSFAFTDYNRKEAEFIVKNSFLPIVIISKNGAENYEYENSQLDKILGLVKIFPSFGFVVVDRESPIFRKIKSEAVCRVLSYGGRESDIFVTDVNVGGKETNFKINYEGKSVPFWVKKNISETEINVFLPSMATAIASKMNLVEISQLLKNYNF